VALRIRHRHLQCGAGAQGDKLQAGNRAGGIDVRQVQQDTGCGPVSTLHRINGDAKSRALSPGDLPSAARPSSAHARGVNMGFADGSSRFISETIDYRVYQALMTPNGAKSDVPMPSFTVTGKEF
jgi:prepilin-type processing-associated H-X9-DG protein